MINYLSNKFISICLEEKIIDVDSDIYKYGFESILSSYLCIAIVLFTGIFIKYKLIAFFYLLIFYFIRKYSGGYHCDSYLKCIIWTDFIFILSVIMIDNLNYELLIPLCIVCSIFSIKKAGFTATESVPTMSRFTAICSRSYFRSCRRSTSPVSPIISFRAGWIAAFTRHSSCSMRSTIRVRPMRRSNC